MLWPSSVARRYLTPLRNCKASPDREQDISAGTLDFIFNVRLNALMDSIWISHASKELKSRAEHSCWNNGLPPPRPPSDRPCRRRPHSSSQGATVSIWISYALNAVKRRAICWDTRLSPLRPGPQGLSLGAFRQHPDLYALEKVKSRAFVLGYSASSSCSFSSSSIIVSSHYWTAFRYRKAPINGGKAIMQRHWESSSLSVSWPYLTAFR